MARTTTPESNVLFSIENEELLHFADEQFEHEPGDQVIRNILNFSKAYEVKPSKRLDHVEHLLN